MKTEHPENRFDATYPPEVIRAAEDLIRSNKAMRALLVQIARVEALMLLTGGQLAIAVGEATREMSADDAASVMDAIEDYARSRATRSEDDILDFDKP